MGETRRPVPIPQALAWIAVLLWEFLQVDICAKKMFCMYPTPTIATIRLISKAVQPCIDLG